MPTFATNNLNLPFNQLASLKHLLEEQIQQSYPDFKEIAALLNQCMQISEAEGTKIFDTLEENFKQNKSSLLYRLIQQEKTELALLLIKKDVQSIHSKNGENGETILHLAAKMGNLEVVKTLVTGQYLRADECYIDPYRSGKYNKVTVLGCCIIGLDNDVRKNLKFVKPANLPGQLLERYNLDKLRFDKIKDVFKFLITQEQELYEIYVNGKPLLIECLRQELEDLAALIINKVDVREKENLTGRTALHYAASKGLTELVKRCFEKNADPNVLALSENIFAQRMLSPLHIAVSKGDAEMTRLLLNNNANPNLKATDIQGLSKSVELLTPFQMAVAKNNRECVNEILNYTAQKKDQSLDTSFPGTTSIFCEKGLRNMQLLLKTTAARQNGSRKNLLPLLRCYNEDTQSADIIDKILYDFLYNHLMLRSARQMCKPIIEFLIKAFKRNPELGLYCLKPVNLGHEGGCYNPSSQSELVITTDFREEEHLIPVLLHEVMHMAAHLIYSSHNCTPPQNSFKEAWKKDKELFHLPSHNCPESIKILFLDVENQSEDHHAREYFARILQAITIIALNNPYLKEADLINILEESIPNLFRFFLDEFIPACQKYNET